MNTPDTNAPKFGYNQNSKRFTVTARLNSVAHALNGIIVMLRTQHNALIHAAATIAVLVCGFLFHLNTYEWCLIIIVCTMVLASEAFNTAIELLCDLIKPEFSNEAKNVKDVAAGAVLSCAIGALCIGVLIFGSKIFPLF